MDEDKSSALMKAGIKMVMQNRPKPKDGKKIGFSQLHLVELSVSSRVSRETPPGEGRFLRAC